MTETKLDDEQICEAVAAALTADGLPSEAQYTGGGIWCVSIEEWREPKASWLCGMSCEVWAGSLMESDSYALYEGAEGEHFIHTDVSSESQDVAAIANALARAVRAWRGGQPIPSARPAPTLSIGIHEGCSRSEGGIGSELTLKSHKDGWVHLECTACAVEVSLRLPVADCLKFWEVR